MIAFTYQDLDHVEDECKECEYCVNFLYCQVRGKVCEHFKAVKIITQ